MRKGQEAVGILAVAVFLEHVDGLTLAVNHHQSALVTTIDFIDGAVFVFEHAVRGLQCHLILWQFEFELR